MDCEESQTAPAAVADRTRNSRRRMRPPGRVASYEITPLVRNMSPRWRGRRMTVSDNGKYRALQLLLRARFGWYQAIRAIVGDKQPVVLRRMFDHADPGLDRFRQSRIGHGLQRRLCISDRLLHQS